MENRRKVPNPKNGLKPKENFSKSEPANKHKTKHSSKNAPAAQDDKVPVNVPAKPVKTSYANIVQKESTTVNLPVEKPTNDPKVCLFLFLKILETQTVVFIGVGFKVVYCI